MTQEALTVEKALDQAQVLLELGRTEQAIPLLSRALAHEPDNDFLHCRLADAFFAMDNYASSMQHAQQALALNPNSDHALYRMAWLALEANDFRAALEYAEAAVRIDADDEANLFTLACAQHHNGHLHKALKTAERALQLNPESAELHILIGDLTYHKRHYKQAEQHYRAALKHDPENLGAHINLGECLAHQHNIAEATEHLFTAVKIDPANESARQRLYEIVHHEIMDQPLQSQEKLLNSLDPAIRHFYQDQLDRRGWSEKIRIGSVITLWLFALGILMVFFTIATGDDASKMIKFVYVVGLVYAGLFITKLVMSHYRKRKEK